MEPTPCNDCGRPVARLPLAQGGWGAFEPHDWPIEEVPDQLRYAYHRHLHGVVDLGNQPARTLPTHCLMLHACDQTMRGMGKAGDTLGRPHD